MKKKNIGTESSTGMGKEDTMPVIFMEEKIMLEAEYEKEREKIEGKEDDRSEEELIQALQTIITSLQGPLNIHGYKRYEELLCPILPEIK